MQLLQAGNFEQAKSVYEEILQRNPCHADALHLSGLASMQMGAYSEAVTLISRAVDLVPEHPVLRNNLGLAMHRAGALESACAQLYRALEIRPGYAGAHMNLAAVFSSLGQRKLALEHGRKAVELEPDLAEAWFNLGLFLLESVELPESVESFRRALALRHDYPAAGTSLLYTLNLIPNMSATSIASEHALVMEHRFGDLSVKRFCRHDHDKIRIGYVSADFCRHAVNCFFEPVLERHDRAKFQTYCYSNVAVPDDVTQRLSRLADHWRDISSTTDEALLQQVVADEIDILVDLSGHTKGHRLAIFAKRAAKIQISWLGYPNTTGLSSMDYRVLDAFTAAGAEAISGTETALVLPDVFACFRPSEPAPEISSPPALTRPTVTFGSFHKLEKINDRVIACWSDILLNIPDSRLLLVRDTLDPWHQERLRNAFLAYGARPSQLEMRDGREEMQSLQQWFAEIDILLDTFPWSGHTIACHALYLGVPVVTLAGDSHASRMVGSVLAALGQHQWIATSEEEYREIAKRLASDRSQLAQLRGLLSERMLGSSVCDETGFTKAFELAMLELAAK